MLNGFPILFQRFVQDWKNKGVEAANEGVVVMVGVDDGVRDPMGVVATACLVEPDHFSYFSFRALMRSAKL